MEKDGLSQTKAATSDAHIAAYSDLLAATFPQAKHFTRDYIRWLYAGNPDGQVVGWDAWSGGDLVAHYACIPIRAKLHGVPSRLLLSLNTATHPEWQGKGLFTRLARATYDSAVQEGFAAVIGVANQNSTSGFVNKLGFTLVRPLLARVGVGPLGLDLGNASQAGDHLQRIYSAESLAWRTSNPVNPVGSAPKGRNAAVFWCATRIPGLVAWTERALDRENFASALPRQPSAPFRSPLRTFIGIVPSRDRPGTAYIDIPDQFRPSPLNFIYLALGDSPRDIDRTRIWFDFLDFDAF